MTYDSTTAPGIPARPAAAAVPYIQFPFDTALGETDAPRIYWGDAAPEGVVTASVGDWYWRRSNGQLYGKATGTGNTGWVAVAEYADQVLLEDGLVGTPSLAFQNDPDSGIFLDVAYGANAWSLVAGGVTAIRVGGTQALVTLGGNVSGTLPQVLLSGTLTAGANSQGLRSQRLQPLFVNSGAYTGIGAYGIQLVPQYGSNGAQSFAAAVGLLVSGGAGGTPTVADYRGIHIEPPAGVTLTTGFGLYIKTHTATTGYGIYVEDQSTYAIWTGTGSVRFGGVLVVAGASITLGTNPANAGAIRLPNNQNITARNAANSANIDIVKVDAGNQLLFGAAFNTISFGNSQQIKLDIGAVGAPAIAVLGDLTTGIYQDGVGSLSVAITGDEYFRVMGAAAGETGLWLYDGSNNALVRVTMGANDSGGSGYKLLRVAN